MLFMRMGAAILFSNIVYWITEKNVGLIYFWFLDPWIMLGSYCLWYARVLVHLFWLGTYFFWSSFADFGWGLTFFLVR